MEDFVKIKEITQERKKEKKALFKRNGQIFWYTQM